MILLKIVSGGQTGVDRAALDVAMDMGITCGGWCPKGRRAEDGPIPTRYPLVETASSQYKIRTKQNVRDSDGTLILNLGPLEGGTALTAALAAEQDRPCMVIDLGQPEYVYSADNWMKNNDIRVLNVAGPRASKSACIYSMAYEFLRKLISLAG